MLHIYDQGSLNSISGIRATIFGATGFIGPYVGQQLGKIGSDLVFPHCNTHLFNDEVKELKLCAVSGMAFIQRGMDFDDLDMIDRVVRNSNVVINLVGTRKHKKMLSEHEEANIKVASRIADACKRHEQVARLIHVSALGQSPDSPSLDLRTKHFGEMEVRDRFSQATIFRPSTVFGAEDYFVRIFYDYYRHFYNYVPVPDNCLAQT
jgi:NADH dehydrogenase (ubiquinone) 1 alpha subcomplex subunit 9